MIRMKNGVCGMRNGMKSASDGSFSLSAEAEARLVARGVAEYVDGERTNFMPAPPEIPELPELPEGVTAIPEYSVNMTPAELRSIGKMCGLTFKIGMSKADMVAALDKHIADNTVEDAEPVDAEIEEAAEDDAPVFDAAEAVQ